MITDRLMVMVAVAVLCGSAFAGGLLSKNVAPDKAVVGGALVAVAGFALAAVIVSARRISARSAEPGAAADGGA